MSAMHLSRQTQSDVQRSSYVVAVESSVECIIQLYHSCMTGVSGVRVCQSLGLITVVDIHTLTLVVSMHAYRQDLYVVWPLYMSGGSSGTYRHRYR